MEQEQRAAQQAPKVLFKNDDFLVLSKPAWLLTTSPDSRPTLVAAAKRLDAGAPNLHPLSRLDAPVTGIVVFARNAKANQDVLAARRGGRFRRHYVAWVALTPQDASGVWDAAIAIDIEKPKLRRIAAANTKGVASTRIARTRFVVGPSTPRVTMLHLFPETGRTHQLRVHAAHAGCPLLGDVDYGGERRIVFENGRVVTVSRVMLHCYQVTLLRRNKDVQLECTDPIPSDMQKVWMDLGGDAMLLENAMGMAHSI